MGSNRMDPSRQFSKRLATWTAVFWFAFMIWLTVILIIQPGTSQFVVYMGLISTAVMILNVGAYTRNSIYEKGLLAMLDKTKLELSLGKKGGEDDASTEEPAEGGESNG